MITKKKEALEFLTVLDDKLEKLAQDLEKYPHDRLTIKPTEQKWSAIMIVDHLILTEKVSLHYCKKKLSFNPDLEKFTEKDVSKEEKTVHIIRSPKYKVEAPPHLDERNLRNDLELEELFIQWRKIRNEIKSFLHEQPSEVFEKLLYKHPLAGRMRLLGMLLFFDAHMDAHTRQMMEILEETNTN